MFSVTNSGKSVQTYVGGWIPKPSNVSYIVEYAADFSVPSDFGCPGAVLITNLHGKEFYLVEIIVHGFSGGPVFFPANTWIHSRNDNPESRIIFRNQVSHISTLFSMSKPMESYCMHDAEASKLLRDRHTYRHKHQLVSKIFDVRTC